MIFCHGLARQLADAGLDGRDADLADQADPGWRGEDVDGGDVSLREPAADRRRDRRDVPPGDMEEADPGRAQEVLQVGDQDLVARVREVERARQAVDPGRGRGDHRDLVGVRVQETGHGFTHRLLPFPPAAPVAALLQPIVEVEAQGGLDGLRQQAVGAACQIGLVLQGGKQGAERRPSGWPLKIGLLSGGENLRS
jgi:hypothetical protein